MKAKTNAIAVSLMAICLMGSVRPTHNSGARGVVGAGLGAGTGAIIGSTVGHAAAGALIGGPVRLIGGALIGDQLMGQEQRQEVQQRLLDQNRAELDRLRQENERLRQQQGQR